MTSRQRLDQTLLSLTGEDIRLVGNWDPVPGLSGHADLLAERLNIPKPQLLRCRDIADVLVLMEDGPVASRSDGEPSLF
jgi:hypothetical protein